MYIDQDGAVCRDVQNNIANYTSDQILAFVVKHKFSPRRCIKNYGSLRVDPETLIKLAVQLDKHDLSIQFGAVGDRAVRVALNAIEQTRIQSSTLPHSLVWSQFIDPADVPRIRQLDVHFSITGGSVYPSWGWDSLTIPYFDKLERIDKHRELYSHKNSTYIKTMYPYKTLSEQGTKLSWASSAYNEWPTPDTYIYMLQAMDRGMWVPRSDPARPWRDVPDQQWATVYFNGKERIGLEDLIRAHTINGAIALQMDDEIGSIEVGKRADLVLLTENIANFISRTGVSPRFAKIETDYAMMDGRFTRFDGCTVYAGNVQDRSGCGWSDYVKYAVYGLALLVALIVIRRCSRGKKETASATASA